MDIEMINGRLHLFADDSKRVTNGIDVFGIEVILPEGATSDGFYEITDEEYAKIEADMIENSLEEIE